MLIKVIYCVFCLRLSASIELSNYSFPKDFVFGVASSSYQIEGATYEDGKGENIWDYNLHRKPEIVFDGTNGDVACDSYHKWEEDISLIKNLGANFYRFSIAWPRILPSCNVGAKINKKGIEHYDKFINGLLSKGITPMVTMYHWDLPQCLEEMGGWMNASIVDDFLIYANILFEAYGDRVKHWITFNEPFQVCEYGYSGTEMAPFRNLTGVGGYNCSHHLLLAHGRTYRHYEKKFKPIQKGKVGFAVNSGWFEPKEDTEEDRRSSERVMQFSYGWYMHPVVLGNYPSVMIDRVDAISAEENYPVSRLPKFTKEEIDMLRGSFDFLGVNHYSTAQTKFSDNFHRPSFGYDCGVAPYTNPDWATSTTLPGLQMVPWGFRRLMKWIKDQYNNPPMYVTENGWATGAGLEDNERVRYITQYLSELLKAIHEDGCNVIGYAYWTILDNFEWLSGFSTKFGLVQVDFQASNRTRTPRKSYEVYKKIISSRKVIV
ncbi:hypothetical protein WA026_010709 [Henosepilachna vigintioctopunctata]|uniref:Myrosinase 1 n=1 Tax=Henosepilachna vigintioctopunctata TaxID=420089 RepID=A0AAW1UWC9_9CUCU